MGKKYSNGRVDPKYMICASCLHGKCTQCVDLTLIAVGLPTMCTCTKPFHTGEPRDKQIADPETGTVYGPGLAITIDGELRNA